jgi:hypothetical protein
MKVRQLCKVLDGFAKMYEEAGDERKAQGLRSIANLLEDRGSMETRAFLSEIKKARSRSA